MEKKKNFIGYYIIASAIIWGATIIGCSLKLKGTECYEEISYILGAGAAFHLILIWGPIATQIKKLRNQI
ncbi:hypothetical protein ACFLSE_04870 [Bacteroidota bacterium]